jgi:hypothetical protein
MASVLSGSAPLVNRLPAPVAVLLGVVVLAGVILPELRALVRHIGLMAHEGAHACLGSGLGQTVKSVQLRFSQRLYVIILYGYWTRAEARCRRSAGSGAADYVLADGLPAGFPGPRLPGTGDLLLQLLEEPD